MNMKWTVFLVTRCYFSVLAIQTKYSSCSNILYFLKRALQSVKRNSQRTCFSWTFYMNVKVTEIIIVTSLYHVDVVIYVFEHTLWPNTFVRYREWWYVCHTGGGTEFFYRCRTGASTWVSLSTSSPVWFPSWVSNLFNMFSPAVSANQVLPGLFHFLWEINLGIQEPRWIWTQVKDTAFT